MLMYNAALASASPFARSRVIAILLANIHPVSCKMKLEGKTGAASL